MPKEIIPFDLKYCPRIIQGRSPGLELAIDKFSKILSQTLTKEYNSEIKILAYCIDHIREVDTERSIISRFNDIENKEFSDAFYIQYPRSYKLLISNYMVGYSHVPDTDDINKYVDSPLCNYLFDYFNSDVCSAINNSFNINSPFLCEYIKSTEFTKDIIPRISEGYIECSFYFTFTECNYESVVSIIFPYHWIYKYKFGSRCIEDSDTDKEFNKSIMNKVNSILLPLEFSFEVTRDSLSQSDVIQIPDYVIGKVNNRRVLTGKLDELDSIKVISIDLPEDKIKSNDMPLIESDWTRKIVDFKSFSSEYPIVKDSILSRVTIPCLRKYSLNFEKVSIDLSKPMPECHWIIDSIVSDFEEYIRGL